MGANNIYYPSVDETFKVFGNSFLIINNPKTGHPLKINTANFFTEAAAADLIPFPVIPAPPLSDVLAAGNITGTNNIVISSTQDIRSVSGGTLSLEDSAAQLGNVAWSITNDNTSYGVNTAWVYGESNNGSQLSYQISNLEAIGFGVYADGISPKLYTGKEIVILDNSINDSELDAIDTRSVFIGSKDSICLAGIVNAPIVGGIGITAKASNTLYSSQFRLQGTSNTNDGIFTIATLTGDRTYTFQDASGTVAFISDIPAAQSLSDVLAIGNTSGANDIIIEDGQRVIFNDGGFTDRLVVDTLTGNRTAILQDKTGYVALEGLHRTRDIGDAGSDPNVTGTDHVVFYQAAAPGGTIYLPTHAVGKEVILIRTSGTAAADLSGTNINGAGIYALPTALYSYTTVISDGTNWYAK